MSWKTLPPEVANKIARCSHAAPPACGRGGVAVAAPLRRGAHFPRGDRLVRRGGAPQLPWLQAFLICALAVFLTLPVLADDFKTANALYDAGRFAEAAALYERITPKSAGVYFNLGNAWFRQDKLGLAILNYERARRLAPRDPDILANLKFAQQRLGVDEVNQPPQALRRFWLNAVRSRTTVEWAWLEIGTLWLTLLAVAGCVWLPRWRTVCSATAATTACAWVLVTVALVWQATAPPEAIVLATKAQARFAPLPEATAHFSVTEGTRLRVREDRGQWVLVERADGQQGWLPRDAVANVDL